MSKALFIDTFSRDLNVSAVSVTEVPGRGLALRFGAEVAPLWRMTSGGELKNESLPILVATRGYQAVSSAGFTKVFFDPIWIKKKHVVAIQGFPWMKNKSLRPLTMSMDVLVLRPGTNLIPMLTHGDGHTEGGNSNSNSREAALAAAKLQTAFDKNAVCISEGQSDYCRTWKLVGYYGLYRDSWSPDFNIEHRLDICQPSRLTLRSNDCSVIFQKGSNFAFLNVFSPYEERMVNPVDGLAKVFWSSVIDGQKVEIIPTWDGFEFEKARLVVGFQEQSVTLSPSGDKNFQRELENLLRYVAEKKGNFYQIKFGWDWPI